MITKKNRFVCVCIVIVTTATIKFIVIEVFLLFLFFFCCFCFFFFVFVFFFLLLSRQCYLLSVLNMVPSKCKRERESRVTFVVQSYAIFYLVAWTKCASLVKGSLPSYASIIFVKQMNAFLFVFVFILFFFWFSVVFFMRHCEWSVMRDKIEYNYAS